MWQLRSSGRMDRSARFPVIRELMPAASPRTSPLLRHISEDPVSGVFAARSVLDGTKRIYAYNQVGKYPVFVTYGISVQSILDIWFKHLLVLGCICALAATALVLTVLSAMRQMRRLDEEKTRRLTVEQAALEGQRLELLGQLAAGVAHDFRNIIQAVLNGAGVIERAYDQPERVRWWPRHCS